MIYKKIVLLLLPILSFSSVNDYSILEKTGLNLKFLQQDISLEINRLNIFCPSLGGCKGLNEIRKIVREKSSINLITRLEKSDVVNDNYYKNLFLGSLYFLEGESKNIIKSRSFLKKASKHNFAASEYILGLTYIEKECKKSIPFFEKASYLGSSSASSILATMSFYGICGKKKSLSHYFRLMSYSSNTDFKEKIRLNWGGDLNNQNDYTQTVSRSILLIYSSMSWLDKKYIIYEDTINFDKYHFLKSNNSKIPRHSTRSLLLTAGGIHNVLGSQGKSALKLKEDYSFFQNGVSLSSMWSNNILVKSAPYYQKYLVYNEKYKSSVKDAIYMNNSEIWDTITVGDAVLISDKITHHYSIVYKINRNKNYIEFIDQWTDEFFLKEGLNNSDINAKIIDLKYGKKSLQINKKDFFKVIVGFIATRNSLKTPEN